MEDRGVELLVSDGVLTIRGHKQERREERKSQVDRFERRYGSFQRSSRLPEAVAAERANATLRSAVLEITVQRVARTPKQRRKIAIRGT
jgi:HSP20 family protein